MGRTKFPLGNSSELTISYLPIWPPFDPKNDFITYSSEVLQPHSRNLCERKETFSSYCVAMDQLYSLGNSLNFLVFLCSIFYRVLFDVWKQSVNEYEEKGWVSILC